MAPQELLGRYKEYKAKTKALLYWLTKTAETCCELGDVLKSLGNGSTSKRLPSEAYRLNGAAERTVTTAELVRLAEIIAEAVPAVQVPKDLLSTIDDIIARREECAVWYSAQALEEGSQVAKENDTHRYFIMILRRISDILKAVSERAAKLVPNAKPAPKKGKKKHDPLSNLFNNLDLQEPIANALGALPRSHTKTSAGVIEIEYKLEGEDSAFETWCFLQDLNDVRLYVKRSWEEYSRGEISFLAVSSMTATAIGLLSRADEQFESPFGSTDWLKLIDYLGIGYFVRGNAIWLHPHPDQRTKDPRMPDLSVNVVDLLSPIAFECLQSWKTDANELCRLEKLSKRTGKAQNLEGCDKHRFHPICSDFYLLLEEVHPTACRSNKTPADDFVRGLVEIHRTSDIPMWMVTACQILLDLEITLGGYRSQGVHQLREKFATAKQIAADLEAYGKHHNLDDVEHARVRLDKLIAEASQVNDRVKLPVEEGARSEGSYENEPYVFNETSRPIHSLKEALLPATAGELLTDLSTAIYDIGCGMARHGKFVLSMAHLYKRLRTMGALEDSWPDMEFVISCFGSDDKNAALVAKEGQTRDDADSNRAVQHYQLACGAPMSAVVANAKEKPSFGPLVRLGEARSVRIVSPLLQGLCDRRKQSQTDPDLGRSRIRILETVLHALANKETAVRGGKAPQPGSHLRPSIKATQLLDIMKKRWVRDEPTLNFDFTGFTLSCARLLERLASQPGQIQRLQRDADFADNHATLVQRLLGCSIDYPAIGTTAALLRTYLQTDGKVYTNRANSQSSNRIPKHLRPRIKRLQEVFTVRYDLIRCGLEYANAHYNICGDTLAVYHPGIVPEKDSSSVDRQSTISGGETDPNNPCDHMVEGVSFGSMIPKAITKDTMQNISKDDTKYQAAKGRLLEFFAEKNVLGGYGIDDDALKRKVRQVTGYGLVKLETQLVKDSEAHETWCLEIPKGEESHRYMDTASRIMGMPREMWEQMVTKRLSWVPWSLDAYIHQLKGKTEESASGAVILSIERCTYAMLQMATGQCEEILE